MFWGMLGLKKKSLTEPGYIPERKRNGKQELVNLTHESSEEKKEKKKTLQDENCEVGWQAINSI